MYKNILLSIFIIFIAGCSAPSPKHAPDWYVNIPTSSELFYAVGASDTIENAKKAALISMRDALGANIDSMLREATHQLQPLDNEALKKISEQNYDISKKISLQKIKMEKSEKFKGDELVLISIPKIELFKIIEPISNAHFLRIKQEYEMNKSTIAIKRFAVVDTLMNNFATLASHTGYKKFLLTSYDANEEFKFLKKMKNEYEKLKSAIGVYLVSDVNSKNFAQNIKNEIVKRGLDTKISVDNEESVKLLITSETLETKVYNFFQSKSLIKFTTFDKEKKQIAFIQHTFIAQSVKGYEDAKEQTYIDMQKKIKKLGLFNFMGIK